MTELSYEDVIQKLESEKLSKDDYVLYLAAEFVRDAHISGKDSEALEHAITAALLRYANLNEPGIISQLLFALHKTRKEKYKDVYRENLKRALDAFLGYGQIMYEALLALSDCENDVSVLDWQEDTDGASSVTIGHDEYSRIAILARRYIESTSDSQR